MKNTPVIQLKYIIILMLVSISFIVTGCNQMKSDDISANTPNLATEKDAMPNPDSDADSNTDTVAHGKPIRENMVDVNVELEENFGKMIMYEVPSIGRENPFMPYREAMEFNNVRNSAIKEANEKNAQIIKIKSLQSIAVREKDDISPYSFNLPVPPTSSGAGSAASRITKTKVVGIMYNTKSPSAIINVDNKDYLVRPGDKIIGQEYIVTKINPTWVTAAMGHNVYSAAIGELFSKDSVEQNQTDIYDLKNRFGGRKI